MPNAVSGVITKGVEGIELLISLPLGVGSTSLPTVTPPGSVSTILIGPPFSSAPKIEPGLSLSSKFTKKTADPAQGSFKLKPPPITATYVSSFTLSLLPGFADGILNILGDDQVSPNWV